MIGGRLKANAVAPESAASWGWTRRMIASTPSSGVRRSSNGASVITKSALFDWARSLRKLRPMIEVTPTIPGVSLMICSACRTTSWVRLTEAPSGSATCAKNAPWSSAGRKPVGVIRNRAPVPTTTTASATRLSTETRTRRLTIAA